MKFHKNLEESIIRRAIRHRQIMLAGNLRDKIYGRLGCGSGKRMKRSNRVFFLSENEAILEGFRPCGNCLREAYLKWKSL